MMLEDVYDLYEHDDDRNENKNNLLIPLKIGNDDGRPSLKIKRYIKQFEECPICYDPISHKSNAYLSECGHAFHKSCIYNAYESKQLTKLYSAFRCPMCRSMIGGDVYNFPQKYNCIDVKCINYLDELENFEIMRRYAMPSICIYGHYLGMKLDCNNCELYRQGKLLYY